MNVRNCRGLIIDSNHYQDMVLRARISVKNNTWESLYTKKPNFVYKQILYYNKNRN